MGRCTSTRPQTFKLTYFADYSLNSSSSATTVFRANSLYDPEFAVGGGQPRGFDQLVDGGYRYFYVSKCRLTIEYFPLEVAAPLTVAHYGTIIPQSAEDYSLHPPSRTTQDLFKRGCKYKLIQNLAAPPGNRPSTVLSKTIRCKNWQDQYNRLYTRSTQNSYFHTWNNNAGVNIFLSWSDTPLVPSGVMQYRAIAKITYWGYAFSRYVAPDA